MVSAQKFDIFVKSLKLLLYLHTSVITESRSTTPYDKFCINMPSASISKGALRFILTYRNVSDPTGRDQLDLACLAECDTSTIMRNGNCILHDKCSPVQMEDTIYSGIVTLSQKNNTHMFELCFSNPPIEINETKIHIYYERSCTNTLTSRPILIAEYVKAVVMNITGTYNYYLNLSYNIADH